VAKISLAISCWRPEITTSIANLDHSRVLVLQRDVRTLWLGDVIEKLVAANVNCDSAHSDVVTATLGAGELPAECLFNEVQQIGVYGRSADEDECLS
jgi:hypothetical protein